MRSELSGNNIVIQLRKRARRRLLLFLFSVCVVSAISLSLYYKMHKPDFNNDTSLPVNTYNFSAVRDSDPSSVLALPTFTGAESEEPVLNAQAERINFYSKSLLLLERSTKKVLLSVNGFVPAYPASLVKVMTAVLALEHLPDLEMQLRMEESMYKEFYAVNASMAGYLPGESVTVRELLYGLMLPSGAEAATQLALAVSGNLPDFVALMNKKAQELNMTDTRFTNVTGLHDVQQLSSPYDMALLCDYAVEQPFFRELLLSKQHQAPPTEQHKEGFVYNNVYFKRFENIADLWRKEWTLSGGKTGYTEEAGQTLMSLVTYADKEYILVTYGAGNVKFYEPNQSALDLVNVFDNLLLPYLSKNG